MHTSFVLLVALCLCAINGLILPIAKTDGSLDVSSLLSHIALLEQSLENKASVAEVKQFEENLEADVTKLEARLLKSTDELKSAQLKIAVLETKLDQCSCNTPSSNTSASASELSSLHLDVGHLKQDVFHLQSLHNRTSTTTGSTFTRWGRTSCPADSSVVYKGYTGGTWYDDKGGSSSIVCLPEHPIYAAHTTVHHHESSHIYGSEYQTSYAGNPLQHLFEDDIPCVVCESYRSKSVMIPGRNQCYPGWTLEYWGYLLGGHPTYASAEYICVDSNAEAVPGSKDNDDGQILYIVESHCGSLPCSPYKDNWELSCVVCSK